MDTITVISAAVGGKVTAFKEGADLADFRADALTTWEFDTRPVTAGSLIKTLDGCEAAPESPAYRLAYAAAFARAHVGAVRRRSASGEDAPDVADLPVPVLLAYVGRADTSRGMTDEEFDSLKVPKDPQAGDSGPNAEAPQDGAGEATKTE